MADDPLFSEEHAPLLKAWIVKRLENTSDAEPDVLADYALALLRHPGNATEVRKIVAREMPDFLQEDSAVFVNDVFEALRYKTYLPGAPPPPKQNAFPSGPPTAFAPQLAGLPEDDPFTASSSRFQNYRNRSGKRGYVDLDDPSAQNGPLRFSRGGRAYKQPRRGGSFGGRNGGDEEAGGLQAMQIDSANVITKAGLPQLGMSQNPAPNFGANGQSLTGKRCRDFDTKGFCNRGTSCHFNHVPAFPLGFNFFPPLPAPSSSGTATMPQPGEEYNPHDPAAFLLPQPVQFPGLLDGGFDATRGGRQIRSLAKRRKRAAFSADGLVTDRTKSTVVVENIPEENFAEEQVRGFFGQFGTVLEVSMQPYKRLAIVKFDSWASANAAWKSPKVVFDNRFVKVFWYKDDESSLPPSKPLKGNSANGHQNHAAQAPPGDPSSMEPEIDMEEFMRKQEEAQRIHEEKQKQLVEIQRQREELQKQEKDLLKKHREEKAKLLAALSKKDIGEPNGKDGESSRPVSQSDALRAQLAALEREAKLLGLDPDAQSVMDEPVSSWAPRGRGRGRGGFFRSTGFAPRGYRGGYRAGSNNAVYAAYSLDNRPKKIRVTGTDFTASEKGELLRQYLFVVGEFTDIEETPSSAEITFKDRKTAEKFFTGAQAEGIPGIDSKLELTWAGGSGTPTPVSTPAHFFKPDVATKTAAQERAGAAERTMTTEQDDYHGLDDDKDVDIVLDRPTDTTELDYEVAEDGEVW